MSVRGALVLVTLVVGCSGAVSEDDEPIPWDWAPKTGDLALRVIGTTAERFVDGWFVPGADFGTSCTLEEVVAGCAITRCGPAAETDEAALDVGTVTVESPSFGSATLALEGPQYGRVFQPGVFTDEEPVRLRGTGSATFPAFDLQVHVPAPIIPQSIGNCGPDPTPAAPVPCALNDRAPLVTWQGARHPVLVSLSFHDDRRTHLGLSCAFDAASGKGLVPEAALAKLPRDGAYRVNVEYAPHRVFSGRVSITARRMSRGQPKQVTLP